MNTEAIAKPEQPIIALPGGDFARPDRGEVNTHVEDLMNGGVVAQEVGLTPILSLYIGEIAPVTLIEQGIDEDIAALPAWWIALRESDDLIVIGAVASKKEGNLLAQEIARSIRIFEREKGVLATVFADHEALLSVLRRALADAAEQVEIGFSRTEALKLIQKAMNVAAEVWRPTHRHRKGGLYRVTATDRLEVTRDDPVRLVDYEDAQGNRYAQAFDRFFDGRFELLDGAEPHMTALRLGAKPLPKKEGNE